MTYGRRGKHIFCNALFKYIHLPIKKYNKKIYITHRWWCVIIKNTFNYIKCNITYFAWRHQCSLAVQYIHLGISFFNRRLWLIYIHYNLFQQQYISYCRNPFVTYILLYWPCKLYTSRHSNSRIYVNTYPTIFTEKSTFNLLW